VRDAVANDANFLLAFVANTAEMARTSDPAVMKIFDFVIKNGLKN
jgi:hypothetical protein